MNKILYITYDGLTDPLGQSQVLSYLQQLAEKGFAITILSFEKKDRFLKEGAAIQAIVESVNIKWKPLFFTTRPPMLAKVWDRYQMKKIALRLHKQEQFHLVHCRSYVAAEVGLLLKRQFGVKMLFDMRGWWPDEKLESGSWTKPIYYLAYNYFKMKEKIFFNYADYIVSLTEIGKEEIISKFHIQPEKIGVVPTCVDFKIFKEPSQEKREKLREQMGIDKHARVLIYSGALGGNYDITILKSFFLAFNTHFSNPFIMILSKDVMVPKFEAELKHEGITNYLVKNVIYTEVSGYLCAADVGLIFYKPAFSNIGRSPTKLGEYWASGIPVIATDGIGDLNSLQRCYPHGLAVIDNSFKNIDEKFNKLKFHNHEALRAYAKDYCSLEKGVSFYKEVYSRLVV